MHHLFHVKHVQPYLFQNCWLLNYLPRHTQNCDQHPYVSNHQIKSKLLPARTTLSPVKYSSYIHAFLHRRCSKGFSALTWILGKKMDIAIQRKPGRDRKQLTIIILTPSLRWRISAKWTGIAMIVVIIWPTLCCVFKMVRRCNYSNSTGNRLCSRILFRRVTGRCRNWIICAFNIISFALELWSLTVLWLKNKMKAKRFR